MVNYSEKVPEEKHRILICAILGLSIKNPGRYPNPFFDKGYRINVFEWDAVTNSKGEMVAPDIILANEDRNNSIIFDCKSGKSDKDQAERYDSVEKEDLVDWGISTKNPRELTHDISFVSSFENGGKIRNTFNQWPYDFPVIQVGRSNIEKLMNDFKNEGINDIFPIDIDFKNIPKYIYPVGKKSPEHIIMDEIMRTLLHKMYKNEKSIFKIKIEEIIKDVFPYWDKIGLSTKEKILDNFDRVMNMAADSGLLEEYIDYEDKVTVFKIPNYQNTRSLQSFQSKSMKYIRKLRKDYVQKRLDADEWGSVEHH